MNKNTTFKEEAKDQAQEKYLNQMGQDLINRPVNQLVRESQGVVSTFTLTGNKEYDEYALEHCKLFGYFPKPRPEHAPQFEPEDFNGNPVTSGNVSTMENVVADFPRTNSADELRSHPAYTEEEIDEAFRKEYEARPKDYLVPDYWGANKKDTNPKDAIGIKKVPISVVPLTVIMEVALGMMEGGLKYGRHNFRDAGVRASVYLDALFRHIADWWEGTDIDPDSGLNHITKAITSLVVLRDCMINDNWTDDRPPAKAPAEWLKKYNELAAKILEKYPNPVPAHTQLSKPD